MVLVYLWCKCCIDMVGGKREEEEVEATTDSEMEIVNKALLFANGPKFNVTL